MATVQLYRSMHVQREIIKMKTNQDNSKYVTIGAKNKIRSKAELLLMYVQCFSPSSSRGLPSVKPVTRTSLQVYDSDRKIRWQRWVSVSTIVNSCLGKPISFVSQYSLDTKSFNGHRKLLGYVSMFKEIHSNTGTQWSKILHIDVKVYTFGNHIKYWKSNAIHSPHSCSLARK